MVKWRMGMVSRAVVVGAVVAVAGLVLALPAFAATGDPIPPASTTYGVTPSTQPYGGATFPCSSFSVAGTSTFQINNPRKGTFDIPGTSYSITLSNVTKTVTDWSANGGIIVYDLGINGGSQTAWYKYRTTRDQYGSTGLYNGLESQSGVTGDTEVHGTLQSPGNLYNLSYMTFCYK